MPRVISEPFRSCTMIVRAPLATRIGAWSCQSIVFQLVPAPSISTSVVQVPASALPVE